VFVVLGSVVQQLIVQKFLAWARGVESAERAKAVHDLSLAYLHGGLNEAERGEITTVLTALLDDPSPAVKRAMADVLAARDDVPRHIIIALANDLPSISTPVLQHSPLLTAAELVDIVRMGSPALHMAIAQRKRVPSLVALTLIELAQGEVVFALAQNHGADLSEGCLLKMLDLYGADGQLREFILARPRLPAVVRIELVASTAEKLSSFVQHCQWMGQERATHMAQEAAEHATMLISSDVPDSSSEELIDMVAHLRRTGRLTAGLLMRALLFGERRLFDVALSVLSGQPLGRVMGMVRAPYGSAFIALYAKAGMPEALMPAFQAALKNTADNRSGEMGVPSRKMIGDVLAVCDQLASAELASLAYRLRRLDSEAARQEVREMQQQVAAAPAPALVAVAHKDSIILDDEDIAYHQRRAA
jgi:uncharacterized protein (DUF2336 family)